MIDLAVQGCGIVSHVGLNAPAACAAVRCGLNNFSETRFMDGSGQWITAAEVPLEKPWRGRAKLRQMAAMAVKEAASALSERQMRETPLFLCLAETDRPGRIPDQDRFLLQEIQESGGIAFNARSEVVANGRVGGVQAIEKANSRMLAGEFPRCLVVGVDTYLTASTLGAYEKQQRILTEKNSDGFIPGEAAAAVLLAPTAHAQDASVEIKGVGFGLEKAHIRSEQPLRADGMVQAVKKALNMAGCDLGDLGYRICDIGGEHYYFKEAALVLTRLLRKRKEEFDIWHPAECVGETGAAVVPLVLAVASAAAAKGYSKGHGVLCHFSNDDGQRAAVVLRTIQRQ